MYEESEEDALLLNEIREAEGEKPKKKHPVRNTFIALGVAVVGFVGVVAVFGHKEEAPAPPPAPPKQKVYGVNLDQVSWADQICSEIPKWNGMMTEAPSMKKQVSPGKARGIMVDVIEKNASALRREAQNLREIPKKAHEEAVSKSKDILLTDNYAVLRDGVDPDMNRASQSMASIIGGYASTLNVMAKDLRGVASYDGTGLRSTISNVQKSLGEMSDEMGKNLGAVFTDDMFDNIMTEDAISQVKSCNGSLISPDGLSQEKGAELEKARNATYAVVDDRCRTFIDGITYDPESLGGTAKDNYQSCSDFIANHNPASLPDVRTLDYDEKSIIKPNIDFSQPETTTTTSKKKTSTPSKHSEKSTDRNSR